MQETLNLIKEVILNTAKKYGIGIDRIILFGSRARGDYRENSDWDILIVIKGNLDKKILEEFWLETNRKLVKCGIVPEIIISTAEDLKRYGKYYGFVHYHASREGIML